MLQKFLTDLVTKFSDSTSGYKTPLSIAPDEVKPKANPSPYSSEGTPQRHSKANEIVKKIGLPPITGLSGPKIGY